MTTQALLKRERAELFLLQRAQNTLLERLQSEIGRQEQCRFTNVQRVEAQGGVGNAGRNDALTSQNTVARPGFGDVRFGVYRD